MANRRTTGWAASLAILWALGCTVTAGEEPDQKARKLIEELRACKFRIVYESYRNNNWELMIMNADGSNPANITQTPEVDEMFPHASPDGRKLTFLAEEGKAGKKTREVFYMNLDGTGRTRVGQNGRQPFWSPDGKLIAYLRGTEVNYNEGGSTNRELHFYNIETQEYSEHPKKDISGLLNPCWSPNGKWIVASAMGGMGFGSSIVAIEAHGTRVIELARSHSEGKNIYQCRPDVSPDSKHAAWGKEDVDNRLGSGPNAMWVEVADIDFDSPEPKVTARRRVVSVKTPSETYHVDWSPDGQYIAYSRGPRGGKMERARYVGGVQAPGWDIWVVKVSEPEGTVQVTHDGLSNKEPDWVIIGQDRR